MLATKYLIDLAIPDTPYWIRVETAKVEYFRREAFKVTLEGFTGYFGSRNLDRLHIYSRMSSTQNKIPREFSYTSRIHISRDPCNNSNKNFFNSQQHELLVHNCVQNINVLN